MYNDGLHCEVLGDYNLSISRRPTTRAWNGQDGNDFVHGHRTVDWWILEWQDWTTLSRWTGGFYMDIICDTRMGNLCKEHSSISGCHLTTSLAPGRRVCSKSLWACPKRSYYSNPILKIIGSWPNVCWGLQRRLHRWTGKVADSEFAPVLIASTYRIF